MVRFRRITSTGRYIPEIDGLRFLAIAAVVLYHFYGFAVERTLIPDTASPVRILVQHGYRGVNLFYVISGFILGLPFAAQHLRSGRPVSLRSYFLRRITRLEPPYIICLILCFAYLAIFRKQDPSALLPHLGAHLIYLHNLLFVSEGTLNPVTWSLEVEVQFYCLAPVLANVFRLRSRTLRRGVLTTIIIAAGLAQLIFWNADVRYRMTILFAIQFFLTGFLLADVYLTQDSRKHPAWDLVPLLSFAAIFLPADREIWAVLPFAMLALCMSVFRGPVTQTVWRNSVITAIGGMCYSVYLFHYVLIEPWIAHTRGLGVPLRLLLYFPFVLVVCSGYFLLLERPCMDKHWPQKLMRYLRGRAARDQAELATPKWL